MMLMRLSRWLVLAASLGVGALAASRALDKGAANATRRTIAGPAGTLHVDDGGEGGLPVLFVHSFAGSNEHWRRQLDHLRTRRRALALDLRGHGRSAPPDDGDYALTSQAGDIAAVADAL